MKKDILKGNFRLPRPVQIEVPDNEESLTKKMQSAAGAKLGGSVAYIKKNTPIWRGDKKHDS